MTAFDDTFYPGVITSTNGDADTDGILVTADDPVTENDWLPNGTTPVLQTINSTYCSWETAALTGTSKLIVFPLASMISGTNGQSIANRIAANFVPSGVSLILDGSYHQVGLDGSVCALFAGMRIPGGLATPGYDPPGPAGLRAQISDADAESIAGSGPGDYPFSFAITGSTNTLLGLSAANLNTVLRSGTGYLAMLFANNMGIPLTINLDRVGLRIVGTASDATTMRAHFQQVTLPDGRSAWVKARIRNNAKA